MTLLEATATVIDHCKGCAWEEDAVLQRAVRRLERRLRVLQLRRAKTKHRHRLNAWYHAVGELNGGVVMKSKIWCLDCPHCAKRIFYGDFLNNAVLTGHGKIRTLLCAHCSGLLMGVAPQDETE